MSNNHIENTLVKSKFVEMFGELSSINSIPLIKTTDYFEDGDWIESKDQSNFGIRLLQVGNIGVGEYLEKANNKKYISNETFSRLNCKKVLAGDIIISRLPKPVGRSCIIPESVGEAITAVDLTIVRFNKLINKYYFLELTKTNYWQALINEKITGISRDRISRSNLGEIRIPNPKSTLQNQFAEFVQSIDKLKFDDYPSINKVTFQQKCLKVNIDENYIINIYFMAI